MLFAMCIYFSLFYVRKCMHMLIINKLKLNTEKCKSIIILNEFVFQNIITSDKLIYINNEAIKIHCWGDKILRKERYLYVLSMSETFLLE